MGLFLEILFTLISLGLISLTFFVLKSKYVVPSRTDKVIETDNSTYGIYEVNDIYKYYISNYKISIIEDIKVVSVNIKENINNISYSIICINKDKEVFKILDIYESFFDTRDEYLVRLPEKTNTCYIVVNEANGIKIENNLLSKDIKREVFTNSFLFSFASSFSYFLIKLVSVSYKSSNKEIEYGWNIFKNNLPATWIYLLVGIFIFIITFLLSLYVYYFYNLKDNKKEISKKIKYKIINKETYSVVFFKNKYRYLKCELNYINTQTNKIKTIERTIFNKRFIKINHKKNIEFVSLNIINASYNSYTYNNNKLIKGEINFKHNSEAKARRYKGNITLTMISIFFMLFPFISTIYLNVCYNEYNNLSSTFEYEQISQNNDNIRIISYNGHSRRVIIPSSIDNYCVSQLNNNLFSSDFVLKEVALPDSITSLSSGLFRNCSSLESFDFSHFSSIPSNCFANTAIKSLDNVNFTSIGNYSFAYTNLDRLNIVGSNYFLSTRSFYKCKINEVILDSNCSYLRSDTFKDAHIKNLYLNSSIFNLDNYQKYFSSTRIDNITFGNLSNYHEESEENEGLEDVNDLEEKLC